MWMHASIALAGDDYVGALDFAETALTIGCTPLDLALAHYAKILASVLLGRPDAFAMLQNWIDQCSTNSLTQKFLVQTMGP